MTQSRDRTARAEPVDLNPAFEALVARIGTRIGRKLALTLMERSQPQGRRGVKAICANPDCERAVVAKGLCKSHYNLMLYHRRKAEAATGKAGGRRRNRRSGSNA